MIYNWLSCLISNVMQHNFSIHLLSNNFLQHCVCNCAWIRACLGPHVFYGFWLKRRMFHSHFIKTHTGSAIHHFNYLMINFKTLPFISPALIYTHQPHSLLFRTINITNTIQIHTSSRSCCLIGNNVCRSCQIISNAKGLYIIIYQYCMLNLN